MTEDNSNNLKPETVNAVFSLEDKNDQSVVDNSDTLKENDYHTDFQTAFSKVQEQNYDKKLISKLIRSHKQFISHEQTTKIRGLEASIALLQEDLAVYQYMYGDENTDTRGLEPIPGEASEANYDERANIFEKIVGREIDRLNNDVLELERTKDYQKKEIYLYDSELRSTLEKLRKNKETIETYQKAIQELESNPEADDLREELIQMERANDSMKFLTYQYDVQLRIEIAKRRENETKIVDLQKVKTALENTILTKENSIERIENDKKALKNALWYLQRQKPFPSADVIKRTKQIQSRLIIEQEKNKELEEHTTKLKEEIKCIEIKNAEKIQEAKQQLEIKMDEMNVLLHEQKEELNSKWKAEVDKAIKTEQEKRDIVSQHRDELVQKLQELNSALKEKEHEARSFYDVCEQLRGKVEDLEKSQEQTSREVTFHLDAQFKQADKIQILEAFIEERTKDVASLSSENDKLIGRVGTLETSLKKKLDEERKLMETKNTLSETGVQTDIITVETKDDATCTDAVVNDLSDVPFRFDLDDGSAKTTTGHDYKANLVVPSPDLDQPEPEIYLQESLQEHVTDQEVELADQTYQTATSPEDGPNFYLTEESPQEHDTDQEMGPTNQTHKPTARPKFEPRPDFNQHYDKYHNLVPLIPLPENVTEQADQAHQAAARLKKSLKHTFKRLFKLPGAPASAPTSKFPGISSADFEQLQPIRISASISDLAILSMNYFLVSDYRKLVHLVEVQIGYDKSRVIVPSNAGSMCMISANCAAVALVNDQALQYITINDDKLTLGETVCVNGNIRGISAISDAQLVVSYVEPPAVELINQQGYPIKKVDNKSVGKKIFMHPLFLTVSSDKCYIFVSDYDGHTVIMLTQNLQLLKSFSDITLLKSPRGITTLNDKVLICGGGSDNIVLLDPSSGQMSAILKAKDGVDRPLALAFCNETKTLYVSNCNKSDILRFRLQ